MVLTSRVRGILLLPWLQMTPNPTVGPSEGTWRSSSNRASSKRSIFSLPKQLSDNKTLNLLWNNTWSPSTRLSKFQKYMAYFLPFLILCTPFLKKISFYSHNHCSTSIHECTSIHYNPSIHTPRWWDFPHTEAASGFLRCWGFSTRKIVSVRSTDGISPARRRQRRYAYGLFLGHPTRVQILRCGISIHSESPTLL